VVFFFRDHYNVCVCCTKPPVMLYINLLIWLITSRVAFHSAALRLFVVIPIFLVYWRSQLRRSIALLYKCSQADCPRGSMVTRERAPPESRWETLALVLISRNSTLKIKSTKLVYCKKKYKTFTANCNYVSRPSAPVFSI
jgi:hypothetical protein